MHDINPGKPSNDIAQFLPWLVEMGADEVILDQPVNRMVAQVAVPAVVREAKPPLQDFQPKPAVRPSNWQAVAAGEEGVTAATSMALAVTDLATYMSALDAFVAHPLQKTANHLCALAGATQSRVLLLSDRPRNEEDASGEVMSGKNQVLGEAMLASIGLSGIAPRDNTEQVMLANFIPWRPPGNRMPTEHECQMCLPFIQRLIEIARPQLILCFGPLAGQYLGQGEEAIMRARGKWLDIAGVPLLTTFHPETLLKSPASKRLAWHDLQASRQKLDSL